MLPKATHHTFGKMAEYIATLWLRLHGYRILTRRYLVRGGEIDIIAQKAHTIIFVEVKARQILEHAAQSVTKRKESYISKTSAIWLSRNHWAAHYTFRADAIYIAPWRLPLHIQDAFPLQW